jgi:hypothetical protein
MIIRFIQPRQLFLTLWFLAYFIWVQPLILERVARAPDQKDFTLALILIAVQVTELAGTWLKFPALYARVQANRSRSWGQLIVGLLMLTHIFITALLAFTTIELFGLDLSDDAFLPGMAAFALFFAALMKEGFFLIWWFQLMGMKTGSLPPPPKAIPISVAEIIGDGLLVVFSALAYTVVWEQIATDTFITAGKPFELMLEYSGAVVFFLMVFPATRSLYYAEELLTQRPRSAQAVSWALLLVTMFAALSAIPRIY